MRLSFLSRSSLRTPFLLTLLPFAQSFVTTLPLRHHHILKPFLSPSSSQRQHIKHDPFRRRASPLDDDDDDDDPYAEMKRQYPDLEFVDYSDPDYVVDQGITGDDGDNLPEKTSDSTEAEIEAMREDRRRRNDEYQFETYFKDSLRNGEEFRGEWTMYETVASDEEDSDGGMPRLKRVDRTLNVISKGKKVILDRDAAWRVDGEVIVHEETLVAGADATEDFVANALREDEAADKIYVTTTDTAADDEVLARLVSESPYWPEQLTSGDFRGPAGNMVVGNAYTVCDATPLYEGEDGDPHEGPYSKLRAEIGLHCNDMRYRLKFNYETGEVAETSVPPPALRLVSVTVCRELLNRWPTTASRLEEDMSALFGPAGAAGGLYDPPPVGCAAQAGRYMMVDLEGRASTLFPYQIDQDPEMFEGNGWVMSLDWTPGDIRYQVDRKIKGGKEVKGIYRLELSEVRGEDAEEWRPRDGGTDMRQ